MKECETQFVLMHIKRFNMEFETMVSQELLGGKIRVCYSRGAVLTTTCTLTIDLTVAYSLLIRVPNGLKTALEIFENWIFSVGKGLVEKNLPSVPKVYIKHQRSMLWRVLTIFHPSGSTAIC
jgi:hypothetical protein